MSTGKTKNLEADYPPPEGFDLKSSTAAMKKAAIEWIAAFILNQYDLLVIKGSYRTAVARGASRYCHSPTNNLRQCQTVVRGSHKYRQCLVLH